MPSDRKRLWICCRFEFSEKHRPYTSVMTVLTNSRIQVTSRYAHRIYAFRRDPLDCLSHH